MLEGYRYGFNGKEKDKFGDAVYDYGFRIYNPRIAKFLSVDPLTKSYPMLTPYQFASNSPIGGIDLDGKEFMDYRYIVNSVEARIKNPNASELEIFLIATVKTTGQQLHDLSEFTDLNDATILGTTITRGNEAIDIKGNRVTATDQTFAAAGAFIPFVSGSGVRKLMKGGLDMFQITAKMNRMGLKAFQAFNQASWKLRTSLKAAGQSLKNAQAHHLIPVELLEKENKLVTDAVNNGFDFNGTANGISLDLSRHSGSHPNYTKQVEDMINTTMDGLGSNYDPKDAKEILTQIVDKIKASINSTKGKIDQVDVKK